MLKISIFGFLTEAKEANTKQIATTQTNQDTITFNRISAFLVTELQNHIQNTQKHLIVPGEAISNWV